MEENKGFLKSCPSRRERSEGGKAKREGFEALKAKERSKHLYYFKKKEEKANLQFLRRHSQAVRQMIANHLFPSSNLGAA
jgi:hypothetical protein